MTITEKLLRAIGSVIILFMTACNDSEAVGEQNLPPETLISGIAEISELSDISSANDENEQPLEEENSMNIEIKIGEHTFSETLCDNETADAFKKLLPLTLDMSELNGNEKYFYLSDDLPTDPSRPSKIHTGDLMLYGSNCVVLFYEDFSTSYSYTPIGRIDDPDGLATALGSGRVQVAFH